MFDQTAGVAEKPFTLGGVELLTTENLATLLHRTPAGLRATLQTRTGFAATLRSARVKLGRRVYYRVDLVQKMILDATGT